MREAMDDVVDAGHGVNNGEDFDFDNYFYRDTDGDGVLN